MRGRPAAALRHLLFADPDAADGARLSGPARFPRDGSGAGRGRAGAGRRAAGDRRRRCAPGRGPAGTGGADRRAGSLGPPGLAGGGAALRTEIRGATPECRAGADHAVAAGGAALHRAAGRGVGPVGDGAVGGDAQPSPGRGDQPPAIAVRGLDRRDPGGAARRADRGVQRGRAAHLRLFPGRGDRRRHGRSADAARPALHRPHPAGPGARRPASRAPHRPRDHPGDRPAQIGADHPVRAVDLDRAGQAGAADRGLRARRVAPRRRRGRADRGPRPRRGGRTRQGADDRRHEPRDAHPP